METTDVTLKPQTSNLKAQSSNLNSQFSEFDEIRPYEPEEMKQAFEDLLHDRQFARMIKGFAPWMPQWLRNGILRLLFAGVKTPLGFQKRFMKPIVKYLIRSKTDGCTFDDSTLRMENSELGIENYDYETAAGVSGSEQAARDNSQFSIHNSQLERRFTFLSNHRDIVLDSAFLDVMLVDSGYPTTVEIGIGDNLLIYPWIKRLVRMNKAFTVRRGLTPHEMLRSSQLMSRYIHYAVNTKHENIWLAQREGRAKDSDDRTQDSVLKMLAMGSDQQLLVDKLRDLNIVPLTISYEYDPCDYLKAQEFQEKRDNDHFKKSKQDDLDNMKTGILGYKGRVRYHCGRPVNEWIDELRDLPKQEFYTTLGLRIDREIHLGYRLFPCNYIAFDILEGQLDEQRPTDHYTLKDIQTFEDYLARQLNKIDLPNKDNAYLRERMLTMYANPLRNYLKATQTAKD